MLLRLAALALALLPFTACVDPDAGDSLSQDDLGPTADAGTDEDAIDFESTGGDITTWCRSPGMVADVLIGRGFSLGTLLVDQPNYRDYSGWVAIWRSSSTGCAHEVHGAIYGKWKALGGLAFPGGPFTDEMDTYGRYGKYNSFQHGTIYWTPATGANVVYGAIRQTWNSLGRYSSWLGFPTTDELPNATGRHNHFEGGSIYFQWADSRSCAITTAVRTKWLLKGGPGSADFAMCVSNVPAAAPDGVSKYTAFSNNNRIQEGPTGTFTMHAAIAGYYDQHFAQTGRPKTDTAICGDQLWLQQFESQTVIHDTLTNQLIAAAGSLNCIDARALTRPATAPQPPQVEQVTGYMNEQGIFEGVRAWLFENAAGLSPKRVERVRVVKAGSGPAQFAVGFIPAGYTTSNCASSVVVWVDEGGALEAAQFTALGGVTRPAWSGFRLAACARSYRQDEFIPSAFTLDVSLVNP